MRSSEESQISVQHEEEPPWPKMVQPTSERTWQPALGVLNTEDNHLPREDTDTLWRPSEGEALVT